MILALLGAFRIAFCAFAALAFSAVALSLRFAQTPLAKNAFLGLRSRLRLDSLRFALRASGPLRLCAGGLADVITCVADVQNVVAGAPLAVQIRWRAADSRHAECTWVD